ncbi:hypothetical protein [Arcanobacterium phocae]|uniref:hypothetical protein n=1 Tax=Arcanobacterium phocae TaxID=131112 RepID=UPI001C103DE8|nr:hypothetical protein [Arcanobacterium phocae]
MADLKSRYRFTDLLRIAGIARSTFYYHQAHGRYGHRRIRLALMKDGWRLTVTLVSRKSIRQWVSDVTQAPSMWQESLFLTHYRLVRWGHYRCHACFSSHNSFHSYFFSPRLSPRKTLSQD